VDEADEGSEPDEHHEHPKHGLDNSQYQPEAEQEHTLGPTHQAASPVEALGFGAGPHVGHKHRASDREHYQQELAGLSCSKEAEPGEGRNLAH